VFSKSQSFAPLLFRSNDALSATTSQSSAEECNSDERANIAAAYDGSAESQRSLPPTRMFPGWKSECMVTIAFPAVDAGNGPVSQII
jgi:hypothetical protein